MIKFEEAAHKYTDVAGNNYISVTTLIKQYVPEFDTEYWSLYKAIKDVYEEDDKFYNLKKDAGGWENVVDFWKSMSFHSLDKAKKEQVYRRQQWYKQSWEKKKNEALQKGTQVHKELEQAVETAGTIKTKADVPLTVLNTVRSEYASIPLKDGIYAEQMLWLPKLRIAGTADRVEVYDDNIWVHDYKTNEKIDFRGFRGEKMKGPLSSLENCSYNVYSMQLSLYGYMLETLTGKEIKGLYIYHVPESMEYHVPYRKALVRRMLKDYESRSKSKS